MRTFTLLILGALALAGTAAADPIANDGDFSRAFGMGYGGFDTAIEAGTRDENNNRTIVNGRIVTDGMLTGGLGDGYGGGVGSSAQAVGNQLNVVTQGNWNTVIIDSTQINNGDISATTGD